ncbi:MAG TPA: hypothetical protein VEX43_12935 [Chthoniobacterales bacterium]|nr:hypothetical protein [Chthoniobacterales bacterium]
MRKTLLNYFFCAAMALAAFVATSALFHALLPPIIPKGVAAKLEFFAQNKDAFDTLLVGTSSIYYSVSPEIFDRTTNESGLPTRAFNFGIDAMHPPENFYVLDQILRTQPRNLKWVFLETADIETKLHKVLGTERAVYWHDWPRTKLALRKALNPRGDARWYIRISRLWVARRDLTAHLKLFAQRFVCAGRGMELIFPKKNDRTNEAELELGPRRDGYRLAGHAMSAEQAASFEKQLAQEIAQARPKPLDPVADEAYRDYAQRIRAIGATPLFVVPPLIFQSPVGFREPPPAPGPLLSFNDVRAYPMLFDTQFRIDDAHLTKEGAEEFTRLLAQEFVRRVRQP